jgi:hypothetical protein
VGDPSSVQVNDFEPGIAPSGLFWTIPIAPWAIDVDLRRGRARLRGERVPVPDFHDCFSAVGLSDAPPPPRPSHVSFDVRWPGNGDRQKIRDDTFHFTGEYVPSATTIRFKVSNDGSGVVYTSDPGGQFNPTFDQGGAGMPAIGLERNGVFFR